MIADISSRVGENRGKISRSKEENQHETQATYTLGSIPSNVGVISNYCHIKTPFSFALPSAEGRAKARNLLNDRVIIRELCGLTKCYNYRMHIVNLPESFVENDLSKSSRRHFEREEILMEIFQFI